MRNCGSSLVSIDVSSYYHLTHYYRFNYSNKSLLGTPKFKTSPNNYGVEHVHTYIKSMQAMH